MMTPQDLQDKEFVKAVFGGYDMATVDDFLERITEDYSALYKENAVLKSKLKVLVEKVEEYRSTEDSMRMALLTAQKMGNEIVDEAKEKGTAILAEVNEQAIRRSAEIREKLAVEEARLAAAEKRTSDFSRKVIKLIQDESEFMQNLSQLVVESAAAVPVREEPIAEAPQAAPSKAEPQLDKAAAAREDSFREKPILEKAPPAEKSSVTDKAFKQPEETPEYLQPEPEDQVELDLPGSIGEEEDSFGDFSRMFDQDFGEGKDEVPQAQSKAASDAQEEERIDIARSISASLGGDDDFSVDEDSLWDDQGEPTTKRPKFDFEDLQFGTNFHEDE